jgi:hypothetical protein
MPVRLLLLAAVALAVSAPIADGAPPAPPPQASQPPPAAPPQTTPPPAPPDLSAEVTTTSLFKAVKQVFTGTLKRRGRMVYLEEASSSSGPISYNEYFLYDFDKSMLYRILREEQIYFETPLTLEQRVDAIRKGWVPAAGVFTLNDVNVALSSRDVLLRPDTVGGRPVELLLREFTADIPAIGATPARSVKSYSLIWRDPGYALPVKIAYGTTQVTYVVEYRDIAQEPVEPELFAIPKGFVNLTPY